MANTVINFQKAFQSIVNSLKKNNKVKAVFTFGSIVSGDIWEESDIDLLVVYEDEYKDIRDVYSEVLGIPVHSRFLSKDEFIRLYSTGEKKGYIRNLLIISRIVFSKDNEITSIYNKARYSTDINNKKWNLMFLGKLLKDLGISKKYLFNGGIQTSYEILVRTLDSFSKLYTNLNGYNVSKDALAMATNLNSEFKLVVERLFNGGAKEEDIRYTMDYIDSYVEDNIVISCSILLDYLEDKNEFVSSYDIKQDILFKDFNINLEKILKELHKRQLILKNDRMLEDSSGKKTIHENVYASRNLNR